MQLSRRRCSGRGVVQWTRLALLGGPVAWVAAHAAWVTGITEPILDSIMAFPVTGVVSARHFEEGAAIKEGQVLIELDKRLEELEVERRRLAMELARTELDRVQSLAQKNTISVSREEMDKKKAEFDIAAVEHQLAEETLRRRQIMAPVDGHIAQFYKQVGEACDQERAPVVRVVDTRRCYFVANLEAKVGQQLELGRRLTLELEGRTGMVTLEGSVEYVAPVVDPASGLLRIKVLFENPDLRIRPGVAGRLRLE